MGLNPVLYLQPAVATHQKIHSEKCQCKKLFRKREKLGKKTNQGKRPEETDPTKDHLLIFVNVLFTKKGEGNILFLLFEALGCNSADAIDILLYETRHSAAGLLQV